MSMGFNESETRGMNEALSQSLSQSVGGSQSAAGVWNTQAPFLEALYGQANTTLRGYGPWGALANARQARAAVEPALRTGLETAGNIASGTTWAQDLMRERLGTANPYLDSIIDTMAADVGRNFSEVILPELRAGAEIAGGRGGSRAGIAEGLAAGRAAESIADLSGQLRFEDYLRQGSELNAFTGQQLAGVAAVPGAASALDTAMWAPTVRAWAPLTAAAGIYGRPILESQASSFNRAQSQSLSEARGMTSGDSFGKSLGI